MAEHAQPARQLQTVCKGPPCQTMSQHWMTMTHVRYSHKPTH